MQHSKIHLHLSPKPFVEFQGHTYSCAIGRSGVKLDKVEGDGATPVGEFLLEEVYYRPDRLSKPETNLPVFEMTRDMGWCDEPNDPLYNQRVTLPFKTSHEELWREDHVYDVIVVISHNRHPIIKGAGSAVFIHVARPDFTPTAGCIAFRQEDLLTILKNADKTTGIYVSEE